VPSKLLKCAVAYQLKPGIKWDSAVMFEVTTRQVLGAREWLHLRVEHALHQQLVASNDSDVVEPPAQRPRHGPGLLVGGLPIVDGSGDADDVKTLYVPLAQGALAHVVSKLGTSMLVFEPSFFSSLASYPGDLGCAIPLFEDPVAALVQLKFQILAAYATGQVHDPVQWNTHSPSFDPFDFEGMALAEVTFKQPLWQKLHTLPILGKSRGCPIFHYKLAVPLPTEHPGYSCTAFTADLFHEFSNPCSLQVSLVAFPNSFAATIMYFFNIIHQVQCQFTHGT
jgi:hypothetical protein